MESKGDTSFFFRGITCTGFVSSYANALHVPLQRQTGAATEGWLRKSLS